VNINKTPEQKKKEGDVWFKVKNSTQLSVTKKNCIEFEKSDAKALIKAEFKQNAAKSNSIEW
jgi:hypothetical protein